MRCQISASLQKLIFVVPLWVIAWVNPGLATSEECLFKGEIISSQGPYDLIDVTRKGDAIPDRNLGPRSKLNAGDTILVREHINVTIIESPYEPYRVITRADGPVKIGEYDVCKPQDRHVNLWQNLKDSFVSALSAPIMATPLTTMPKRSLFCGEFTKNGIILDLEGDQVMVAGQDRFALHWLGLHADARLVSVSEGKEELLLEVKNRNSLQLNEPLPRALRAGETLKLELKSLLGPVTRNITVVDPDELPWTPQIAGLDQIREAAGTSQAHKSLHAMWLTTQAPPEWHLQGMTLLAHASEVDYVALKAWRAIWDEQLCADDF